MSEHDIENHMIIGNDVVSSEEFQLQQQREIDDEKRFESDTQEIFCSGKLEDPFFYIDPNDIVRRSDILSECSNELCTYETMMNLFARDVSSDVKIDLLDKIRDNVIENRRGKL